jgi:sulfite exporter TauE/SafE
VGHREVIGPPADASICRAERKLKPMTGTARVAAYMVAGLLFEVAGLIYTIRGKVSIGVMEIVIGISFITLAARKARRARATDNIASAPPTEEREH